MLEDGERIIVNKFIYRFHPIERGDVVVFWYPRDPSVSFIKRVVGLPGDVGGGPRGNGLRQRPGRFRKPTSTPSSGTTRATRPWTFAAGYYYVLGDHRNSSNDSRSWGEVPEKYIYGRADVPILAACRRSASFTEVTSLRPSILALAACCLVTACSREGVSASHAAQTPAAAPDQATAPPSAAAPPAALARRWRRLQREVRLLFRVVACGGDEPSPRGPRCRHRGRATASGCSRGSPPTRRTTSPRPGPSSPPIGPPACPRTVVYPFGGGDLLSALLTYPDGLEFTTLSLEHAGDPRRLKDLDEARLAQNLAEVAPPHRRALHLRGEHQREHDAAREERHPGPARLLPGRPSRLTATSRCRLRYFRLEPDGQASTT